LVREAFAERGHECVIDGAQLVDADGSSYRLWNVAASCHGLPDEEWPSVVDHHVRIVLSAAPMRELSTEVVLEHLRLRLVDLDSVPFVETLPHVHAVAPGLVEVITLDLPETVLTPTEEDLRRHGSVRHVVDRARDNLRSVLSSPLSVSQVRADDGSSFTLARGDSFYVASLALLLPELIAAVDPDADLRRGVFLAVPHRHHLAFRPVSGLSSLMAVRHLAKYARHSFESAAGPVSPHVYWLRDGVWQQMTRADDRAISIHVSAELTAIIDDD
jgi:hypothetical protein